ncbi:MAG: DUF3224 domain-containing protein [Gemmatimonadota bacterium]
MTIAKGTFSVVPTSRAEYDPVEGAAALGRTTFAKVFEGDLVATSTVEMLSCMGLEKGSAGYVALERVTGSVAGQEGGFVLQHSGTMNRGEASLTVTVVPDSGSGGLTGIVGTLKIEVVDKKHTYALDYSFGGPPF